MKNTRHFTPFFLLILAAISLSAQPVIKQFVQQQQQSDQRYHLRVIPPSNLLHSYTQSGEAGVGEPSILPKINDSILLHHFNDDLVYYLNYLGLYSDIASDSVSLETPLQHRIRIAQMEIEEHHHGQTDTLVQDLVEGTLKLNYTTLSLHIWIQVSTQTDSLLPILYHSLLRSDDHELEQLSTDSSGHLRANLRSDLLTVNDAYLLGNNLAADVARYLYDYLLNRYVQAHTQNRDSRRYQVNLGNLRITPTTSDNDRFTVLSLP